MKKKCTICNGELKGNKCSKCGATQTESDDRKGGIKLKVTKACKGCKNRDNMTCFECKTCIKYPNYGDNYVTKK